MQYLSDEWIGAADQALKAAAATAPVDELIIDQHIEGTASYRVTLNQGSPSIVSISDDISPPADAVFTQDRATAFAVAQGTTDAHQAFLLGQIRFAGNVNVLIERRDAFAWLEVALAPVMATTTFSSLS